MMTVDTYIYIFFESLIYKEVEHCLANDKRRKPWFVPTIGSAVDRTSAENDIPVLRTATDHCRKFRPRCTSLAVD